MSRLSGTWSRFAASWDELCATMDAEAPGWREGKGCAERTYELMHKLIEEEQS